MLSAIVGTANAAAALQASKRRSEQMKAYLAERKCPYCGSENEASLCPNCGAPQPERRVAWPSSYQSESPSAQPTAKVAASNFSSAGTARNKRRDEEEAAERRRRDDTSYSSPAAESDYSSGGASSSSSDSYSGGGGSFDGGGASGDY